MSLLANSSSWAANTYTETLQNVSVDMGLHLNWLERMWVAWYAYMQNDTLATGIMSFVLHEILYFGRCIPWMIIDLIPYFQKYKIQPNKQTSFKDQWHCTCTVLLSHFTVEAPQIWLFHPMCERVGLSHGVPFPSLLKIAYQVAIFFIMEDTWHYWNHRLLHYGFFYKYIHKLHHTYSAPFGLAAEYASPIETMWLGLGTIGPPLLWCYFTSDLHIVTVYVWIALRLFQAVDAHSGYDFPWSLHRFIPFWAGAEHHDEHHHYFVGNYASSFRWWDAILSTNPKRRRPATVDKKAQ